MKRNPKRTPLWILRSLAHRLLVAAAAVVLSLVFFMVLPLMTTLSAPRKNDLMIRGMETVQLDEPPPPPEIEEEEEEPPEPPEPPEMLEEAPPLDLSQLELALNAGLGGGMLAGDFVVNLDTNIARTEDVDAIFGLGDLDQKPRVVHQPSPRITPALRKKAPGTVYVIFLVDQNGRVVQPQIQRSSDPVFESPALNAVKQWKFEPGKRQGQPVRFRMRVPITFPEG